MTIPALPYTYLLASAALFCLSLFNQPLRLPSGHQPVAGRFTERSTIVQDSLKKQPAKSGMAIAQPTKRTHPATYSPAGHYTVTVPAINSASGKADLILVNGTKQVERIGDVDSNDIESIEVFRDAKTIAKYKSQYGEKAAKGVVIIYLKKH